MMDPGRDACSNMIGNLEALERFMIENDVVSYKVSSDYALCDNMRRTITILFDDIDDMDILFEKRRDPTVAKALRERDFDVRVKFALMAITSHVGYVSRDFVCIAKYLLKTLRFRNTEASEIVPANFVVHDMLNYSHELCLKIKNSI